MYTYEGIYDLEFSTTVEILHKSGLSVAFRDLLGREPGDSVVDVLEDVEVLDDILRTGSAVKDSTTGKGGSGVG